MAACLASHFPRSPGSTLVHDCCIFFTLRPVGESGLTHLLPSPSLTPCLPSSAWRMGRMAPHPLAQQPLSTSCCRSLADPSPAPTTPPPVMKNLASSLMFSNFSHNFALHIDRQVSVALPFTCSQHVLPSVPSSVSPDLPLWALDLHDHHTQPMWEDIVSLYIVTCMAVRLMSGPLHAALPVEPSKGFL